ncbi:L-lactate dehydrogenase (plasmid) [Agrobacterium radiobacter]|nr:L-lactate dehydrogenase [Agrobacterium tumefaciens]MQB27847.1 L-lactate dehydrogenase [Agrobacterium tumefaciens]NTA08379.1 L-lactate dehydrogenase [Agrobacterium tumefaciens]NTB16201.1 L-lactate dehydrogenase [Agrobacterium tumefaciens]
MPGKVGIVGAGQVGATTAFLLATVPGVREVVLVDADTDRAHAQAADIAHAAAFGMPAEIAAGDYADLAGAHVIAITAGSSLEHGQTRLDLLSKNVTVVSAVLEKVAAVASDAVLLFATNPVDVMPALAVRRFCYPRARAIATGCALDTARFRNRLARHFDLSPRSVHGYVLGEHGDSEVLHWSGVQIGGMPVAEFAAKRGRPMSADDYETITREVRTSAYRIKQGKGVSNFAIGGCIARLTHAIINDEDVVFSVSTFLDEVLDIEDTCISLPQIVDASGASMPFIPSLEPEEEEALRRSATVLRDAIGMADRMR